MEKNLLYRVLSRFVEIKPGEEILCFYLFLYFFSITAPNTIIQAFKNTKYLVLWGSRNLPIAYLLTAVLMGFVVAFHTKLQEKLPQHLLIVSSLLFFIVTCPLFGILFMGKVEAPTWLPLTFWVWSNVFVVVLITQFWMVINDIFNPREAKRLIGFFGSGGILGGIVGGLFGGFLARTIPDYLLFVATGILILSCLFINYVFIRQKRERSETEVVNDRPKGRSDLKKVGFRTGFDAVRNHKYLVLIASVVAITEIVSTLIDFQTKTFIEVEFARKNLLSFFAFFEAALLVIPLLFQLFITSKLIKRYGILVSLLLYPLTILACSLGLAGFAMSAGFYFAIIIKTSDKSLSFSINQSIREILYIPVAQEYKNRAKIFIDMFINRVAKGAGALILMVIVAILPLLTRDTSFKVQESETFVAQKAQIVSIISVLFIFVWIYLNVRISREYTNTIKKKLKIRWKRADAEVDEKLDIDFTKLILDTLEDKERSEVLYAMDLFDLIKKDKLTPEVRKLIGYRSDEMKISSMGVLFQTEGATFSPEMDDAVIDQTMETEIGEIMQLDSYKEVMQSYMDQVLDTPGKNSETVKMELAKGIGLMDRSSPLVQRLEALIQDPSLNVSRYAMESAARLKLREHLPFMIDKLKNPLLRIDVSSALAKYGTSIIGMLSDYLSDAEEDIEVRKVIVTLLAQTKSQEAADFLALELARDGSDLENEIIDSLDRIVSGMPEIQFSEDIIMPKILNKIKDHCRTVVELHDLHQNEDSTQKIQAHEKKLSYSLTEIFKLLGLLYPNENTIKAYQHIELGTKDSIAYALELLDNTLPKEIKNLLFPLVDDLSLKERARFCSNALASHPFLRKM
jgi:AAA family ATP:ADP antiporter